jgi:lipopolysaccharide transport system ATP-binding protein
MTAVSSLCTKGLLLKDGMVKLNGEIDNVILSYANEKGNSGVNRIIIDDKFEKQIRFTSFNFLKLNNGQLTTKESAKLLVTLESKVKKSGIFIGVGINDNFDNRLFTLFSRFQKQSFDINVGTNIIHCDVDFLVLKPGTYFVELFAGNDTQTFDYYDKFLAFDVYPQMKNNEIYPDSSQGCIVLNQKWRHE